EHVSQNKSNLYRQIAPGNILQIKYYDKAKQKGFNVKIFRFQGDSIAFTAKAQTMHWIDSLDYWRLYKIEKRMYDVNGYITAHIDSTDTAFHTTPRDLARSTSDIYQLSWPEAQNYIQSLKASGATSVETEKVEYFGLLTYSWSAIIVVIIGFSLASTRRKLGKGFYIAAGLLISFIYLAVMKIIEPFGSGGLISPIAAAVIPHLFFFIIGVILLALAKK